MKEIISEAVKARMKERRISFQRLSEQTKVSTSIIQKIRDRKNYEIDSLVKIMEALEIKIDCL